MARKYKKEIVKSDPLTRRRIETLLIIFSLLVIALIVRVGYWQIIKADWLKELAQDQWSREIRIFADRGDILDKNGNPLAVSSSCYTVVLQPGIIKEQAENINSNDVNEYIDSLSQDLAAILGITPAEVKKAVLKEQSQVILKRSVTDAQTDAIRSLMYNYTVIVDGTAQEKSKSYSGIIINEDVQREYPMGSFLTQVLGFTSIDGIGLEGIESRFDKYLAGENGKLIVETDREGIKISDTYEQRIEPIDGNSLHLTIDATLQSFAESALDLCLYEQIADSATCIVMDPNTGAILAMANKPDYDNNEPPRYDLDLLRELTKNKAVSNVFEPGSMFELITAAAALDSSAVTTNTRFDCAGFNVIEEQKINCWSDTPHGNLDLIEAMQESCDVAFMNMAINMGKDTFYDYMYAFGFGSKTGIKLYGESAGNVTDEKYVKNVDLARIGFGQAIEVTPLQLVSAVSALVNGGQLMQPYIAQKIVSPEGQVLEEYFPQIINEVISDYTSDLMLNIMYEEVENGSGRNCQIAGYEIGGKASISQKYDEEGNLIHNEYISSFIAVAPINNPRLVVLITVDDASAGANYGSVVAAPYVKDFLEEALPYLNILPNNINTANNSENMVPNLIGMTLKEGQKELSSEGFGCISEGFDGKIVTQIPRAGTMLDVGDNVIVQLEQVTDSGESYLVEVPDLFGLSPTDAMKLLSDNNLTMRIVNSGNVVMEQYPSEGTEVYRGSQVAVEFEYFENEIEEELEN